MMKGRIEGLAKKDGGMSEKGARGRGRERERGTERPLSA